MFKRLFSLGWCKTTFLLLLPGFIVAGSLSAQAETDKVPQDIMQIPPVTNGRGLATPPIAPLGETVHCGGSPRCATVVETPRPRWLPNAFGVVPPTSFQSLNPVSDAYNDRDNSDLDLGVDPLDSPYPIPWNWLMTTQSELSAKGHSGLRYYRTPSLISPDGQYAVYSRIQMNVESELFYSRVSSVMFVENLQTGELQVIRANSPLANHLLEVEEEDIPGGTLSILIPVSWSEKGDRLLCRQLEGFLSTSDASDYAVIWDRKTKNTTTINPERVDYTNAVLLGWDSTNSDQVLFRAGSLGEEDWPIWAVALNGQTVIANQNTPVVYGQLVTHTWTGSQVLR